MKLYFNNHAPTLFFMTMIFTVSLNPSMAEEKQNIPVGGSSNLEKGFEATNLRGLAKNPRLKYSKSNPGSYGECEGYCVDDSDCDVRNILPSKRLSQK